MKYMRMKKRLILAFGLFAALLYIEDASAGCIQPTLTNQGGAVGTKVLTLKNTCSQSFQFNTIKIQFDTALAGGVTFYLDNNSELKYWGGAAKWDASTNTATYTYSSDKAWPENASLSLDFYAGQSLSTDNVQVIAPSPVPSKGILNVTTKFEQAIWRVYDDQGNLVLQKKGSARIKLPLNKTFTLIPEVYDDASVVYAPVDDGKNKITLTAKNYDQSFSPNYQAAQTGQLAFDLAGTPLTQIQRAMLLQTTSQDYAVTVPVSSQGRQVPGNTYALPSNFSVSTAGQRCAVTFLKNSVTVVAGQASTIKPTVSCQSVAQGQAVMNIRNDRTLSAQDQSAKVDVILQSKNDSQSRMMQTVSLKNGAARVVFNAVNVDDYTVLVQPAQGQLRGYDIVPENKTFTVKANTENDFNIDLKYAGTYRYLTPSQFNGLIAPEDNPIILGNGNAGNGFGYHAYFAAKNNQIGVSRYLSMNPDGFNLPKDSLTFDGQTIEKDKLWAMSAVAASLIGRTELNYGRADLKNGQAYFDTSASHRYTTQNLTFAQLMYENFNPRMLFAQCLQESDANCQLSSRTTVYEGPKKPEKMVGSGGVFQINSYDLVLPNPLYGFPMPFAILPYGSNTVLDQQNVGPLKGNIDNFLGAIISSVFFDATNYLDPDGLKTGVAMQKLFAMQDAQGQSLMKGPHFFTYVTSELYNQGQYSLNGKIFAEDGQGQFSNLQYCAGLPVDYAYYGPSDARTDVRANGRCFPADFSGPKPPDSTGALYPFQLPTYADQLKQGTLYDVRLTKQEIDLFLQLLGPKGYGFYDAFDTQNAIEAADAAFDRVAQGANTISFKTQFFGVLSSAIQKLPVYIARVSLPGSAKQ